MSLLGARTAGTLSDRGRRRWLVTAVVLLAGAVGTWVATSPATAAALAGALLASVTPGGVQATVPAIAGDRSHVAQHGRMLSVAYTLGDLGSAIGPALALGLVASLSISAIYRAAAVLLACTVIFALWRSKQELRRGSPRITRQRMASGRNGETDNDTTDALHSKKRSGYHEHGPPIRVRPAKSPQPTGPGFRTHYL